MLQKKVSNLKKHIESFHEERTVKCEICPSHFTEKCSLKKDTNPFIKEELSNVIFSLQILQGEIS